MLHCSGAVLHPYLDCGNLPPPVAKLVSKAGTTCLSLAAINEFAACTTRTPCLKFATRQCCASVGGAIDSNRFLQGEQSLGMLGDGGKFRRRLEVTWNIHRERRVHIILVSNRLATAKSIQLDTRHLALLGAGFGMLVMLLAMLMYYVTFRHAVDIKLPLLHDLLMSIQQEEKQQRTDFMRENLNAMAVKVGEMQAQLMRLDALGERLSALSGIKPQEFRFNEQPGRGGALSATPGVELSVADFSHALEQLQKQVESRTDYLGLLETQLLDKRIKSKLMPTIQPWTRPGTRRASVGASTPSPGLMRCTRVWTSSPGWVRRFMRRRVGW